MGSCTSLTSPWAILSLPYLSLSQWGGGSVLMISPPLYLWCEGGGGGRSPGKRNGLDSEAWRREPRGATHSRRMRNGRCWGSDRCLAFGQCDRCERGGGWLARWARGVRLPVRCASRDPAWPRPFPTVGLPPRARAWDSVVAVQWGRRPRTDGRDRVDRTPRGELG